MNFTALDKYLATLPTLGVPGCDLQVWQNHNCIYRGMAGEAHPGIPMRGDETYWLYSASKVFCATATMQLVERGVLSLEDPVSKFLPEYSEMTVRDGDTVRKAKNTLTVRHLITMCGGFDYELETYGMKEYTDTHPKATTREVLTELAKRPLCFEPGTHMQYSLCHDVMAGVIEAATGMTYGAYLQKEICEPLGITDVTMHPTEAQLSRLAAQYEWKTPNTPTPVPILQMRYRLTDNYESGGAGLMGAADSYILLADALACDGVGKNGAQILTRPTIDLMRTDQMHGAARADFDAFNREGYSYAMGVRTLIDNTHSKSPVGEFGWDSAGGAWVMIDPEHNLSALYTQHVLNCGDSYYVYHPAIRDLIYTCLEA